MLDELLGSPDLWEFLAGDARAVVLYGMGNGAEKILRVCEARGIAVRDVFASDDFVRGQEFRGFRVCRWDDIQTRYGVENTVVLVAFGTARPDVLDRVRAIAAETALFVPDLPPFGDGLFDRAFALAHRDDLLTARGLLFDDASRRIFDLVLRARLTGDLNALLEAVSTPEENSALPRPEAIRAAADLGAYTGDTVRALGDRAPGLETVYAMEPDPRNFRKLAAYAAQETRFRVVPVAAAAWDTETDLVFEESGNRNASAAANRSAALGERPARTRTVPALPLDRVVGSAPLDYIKYDVEGSEREALLGSREVILRCAPALRVAAYHRAEDLFALPLFLRERFPVYRRFYLRRAAGIPAWDLDLWAVADGA